MDVDSSTLILSQVVMAVQSSDTQLRILFNIIVLILLILFNAAFAASEMAVITLNDNHVKKMAEEGDKNSKRILKFIEKPTNFLSTIQVGITFAGFFASAFAADKFAPMLTRAIDPGQTLPWLSTVSVVVITMILSYVSLVFGELVPKRVAMKSPYAVIKYTLGLLIFTGTILKPFVKFLTFSTNLVLRAFGINPSERERKVTEEEIRMMVNVGRETGTIHETELEMIENIFDFNDTQVSQIMTHRTDLVSLDCDATFDEVVTLAVHEKFTRIPVYKDSIDNIIGILHIKDLLSIAVDGMSGPFKLEQIIREPLFVPETKTIDEAFREMQTEHVQIAVVIDEYGGTAGIITVEDLLEEIVGNMQDEYDEEDEEIVREDENTLIVEGKTALDEISDELDIEIPEDRDYDTIAGMFIDILGRIPDEDEQPEVTYSNLTMRVMEMDDRRISKIKITVNNPEQSAIQGEEPTKSEQGSRNSNGNENSNGNKNSNKSGNGNSNGNDSKEDYELKKIDLLKSPGNNRK